MSIFTPDFWDQEWQAFIKRNRRSGESHESPGFWDRKAASFARSTMEGKSSRTEGTLAFLRQAGVHLENSLVLDVGCGTGVFALPFAEQGAQVTAIDSSTEMLALLQARIPEKLQSRIETVELDWLEADIEACQWQKAFDLVFAANCPAIRSLATLEKMCRCSREWCFYGGFSGPRQYELYNEAYSRVYGEAYPNHFNDVIFPLNILYALGYKPRMSFLETEGIQEEPPDNFRSELQSIFPVQEGSSPRVEKVINEVIQENLKEGMVRQRVRSSIGLIVWRV